MQQSRSASRRSKRANVEESLPVFLDSPVTPEDAFLTFTEEEVTQSFKEDVDLSGEPVELQTYILNRWVTDSIAGRGCWPQVRPLAQ